MAHSVSSVSQEIARTLTGNGYYLVANTKEEKAEVTEMDF
jgi:hypothetical protein